MTENEKDGLMEFIRSQPDGRARIVAPIDAGYLTVYGYVPEEVHCTAAVIDAVDEIIGDAVASELINHVKGTEALLSVSNAGDIILEIRRVFA